MTSILSRTCSMSHSTAGAVTSPGTATRELSLWGCPPAGCGPSLPPCGAHPSLELAHPAAPHRSTWELNIPSAHHWCINYEPQCEKAEWGAGQRKIPIGCLEGGLAPQDESSAGWHLPCQTSSFSMLSVLQRLRSVQLYLTQPLASAPSAVTSGPTHGFLKPAALQHPTGLCWSRAVTMARTTGPSSSLIHTVTRINKEREAVTAPSLQVFSLGWTRL